jgi:hypothetical protein
MWDFLQNIRRICFNQLFADQLTSFPEAFFKIVKREYQQELRFCHPNQIKLKLNADVWWCAFAFLLLQKYMKFLVFKYYLCKKYN